MLDSGLFVSSNGFACSFEKTINEVVALFLVVFVFGSSSDYQSVQVNEINADTPYSKSYIMFRLSVLDQFFGFASCYVEKMTADEQFGRVENTSQYPAHAKFHWQEEEDEDAHEARIAKTSKAKIPPVTILGQRFLYQEPTAPFSTGPDVSFAWFRTQFPIFKAVLHIKDFSLRFQSQKNWCFFIPG